MQYPGPSSVQRARTIEEKIKVELARQVIHTADLRLAGHLMVALALAANLRNLQPVAWNGLWLALFLGHQLYGGWFLWRVREQPIDAGNVRYWLWRVTTAEAMNGLLWMIGTLMMFGSMDVAHRVLSLILVSLLYVGVMLGLAMHTPALYAGMVPPLLGFSLAALLAHGQFWYIAPVGVTLWLVINITHARKLRLAMVTSLRNRFEAVFLAQELDAEKTRALELSESRSRLLAVASHDLRQPLHALSQLVGAMSQVPQPAEGQRLIAHMRDTVDGMTAMFGALLDISKLDAHMVQPELAALPLRALLTRVAADEGVLAQAKGLQFHCDTQALGDVAVLTDPQLLERVVRNLVSNAVRYTQGGSVRLVARLRAAKACVHVIDTGAGIPADQRKAIFQEFVRLQGESNGADQGLGLGLAIVQRLSGLLGVRVGLRSQAGRGSVFTLAIPLAIPMPLARPPATTAPISVPAVSTAPLSAGDVVLLIDDASDVRLATSTLLAGWGCRVLAAKSPKALAPQLATLDTVPRLILCDQHLRGERRGVQTIECLRADFNETLPAILVTIDMAPERQREAAACGVQLLRKPVTPAALKAAIALALAPRSDQSLPAETSPTVPQPRWRSVPKPQPGWL
jgi:signal transduction histidine kinase